MTERPGDAVQRAAAAIVDDTFPDPTKDDAQREAWIADAERAVREQGIDVPDDHPARAWDPQQAERVELLGPVLVRGVRPRATAVITAARKSLDVAGARHAENWRKRVGRIERGSTWGAPEPDRWLEIARMVADAGRSWLPLAGLSAEQRKALDDLLAIDAERRKALEQGAAEMLAAAVETERARRSTPEAWETELAQRSQDKQPPSATGHSVLATLNAPDRYEIEPPYEVDRHGVWMVRPGESGDSIRTRIATAPLLVVRVFTDPAGDQLIELAWKDGPIAVTRTVPRAIAKSGRALIKALGNAGIPIVEADARQVERYLAAVEADNRSVIPRDLLARQLGWQPDGEFVTGQDTPRHVEPAFEEQRSPLAAHRPSGTLAEWRTIVKALEPYPIPRIMLAAGFAAPLLELLRVDSFTIDLSGRSTGGKTVSAMVAFSVWGCPTEQGGGIASWRTTLLAAEKRMNLCNGVPVVFDETRAVKVEGLVDQVLYQVPMNRGTSRGGGYPSDLPWRTVLISTGEQPALSFTTNEGASARILSLRGAPFGRNGETSERVAREVSIGVAAQFGTAGPAFAARLREELATADGLEKLRRRHRELVAEHQEGGDINKRRAPRVAVVRLAAELAYAWNICPLPSLDVEQWTELLSVEQQRDDRGEMALDIAREFVGRQIHRMWTPLTKPDDVPTLGWIGAYLEPEEGRKAVALLPKALGEELERVGYRIDAIREAWIDSKLITLDTKGELIRRRFDGGRLRVYEFDRALFDADDGSEAAPAANTSPPGLSNVAQRVLDVLRDARGPRSVRQIGDVVRIRGRALRAETIESACEELVKHGYAEESAIGDTSVWRAHKAEPAPAPPPADPEVPCAACGWPLGSNGHIDRCEAPHAN